MSWDKDKDTKVLLDFKDNVDSDDVKVKEKIKEILKDNRFIVHVLNNKELEENDAEPSDYFGVNILPYYMIPDTQTSSMNFLCYEVSYENTKGGYNRSIYNTTVKRLKVIFYILCHNLDIIDSETGIARHDLLAALIQDQFNFTTKLGGQQIILTSDIASTTDSSYATRTLTFEQITDNNVVRTKGGTPSIINKSIDVSENWRATK